MVLSVHIDFLSPCIINNSTKFKDQLEVESVCTSRNMCIYTNMSKSSQLKPSDIWGEKILSMPSFGREVEPFAPCYRFAACKRSLNGVIKKGIISAKSPDHSRPQFHLSLLGALALMGTWRHLAAKVETSKGRGKQWQTTPKNLPRMQRARAILVA
jgi:hypothetical protein